MTKIDFACQLLTRRGETHAPSGAYPTKPDLEDALKSYANIKPDVESVQKYRQALCDVWDRRFGTEHP